jgi:hypothetical protein
VSAEEYQRAFADLLRSPRLCAQVRRHAEPLAGYDLTDRERSRLRAVSEHRGMVVNCTLYRASRLVGITRRLPGTVERLGPRLREVFDAYLDAQPDAEAEFDREARRFADFLAANATWASPDVPWDT